MNFQDNLKVLTSGAIAGAVSRTVTAPLERLKIFNQVGGISKTASGYTGITSSLTKMVREEGWRGLFKGNGTNCVKVVPASAIRFVSFENFKKLLLVGDARTLSTERKLLAGSAAGCMGVCLTYPLDLIRTRLSLQVHVRHYTGIADAFRKIVAAEGPRGLFRGVGAAFTSVAPFSALNFTCYELLKEYIGPLLPFRSIALSAAYGAMSGVTAMTILYPLDLLKRQLMVQGHGDAPVRYRNALHAGTSIFAEQGLRGLYRGILPSYLKVIPTVSLTWLSYEIAKRSFGITKEGGGGVGGFG